MKGFTPNQNLASFDQHRALRVIEVEYCRAKPGGSLAGQVLLEASGSFRAELFPCLRYRSYDQRGLRKLLLASARAWRAAKPPITRREYLVGAQARPPRRVRRARSRSSI